MKTKRKPGRPRTGRNPSFGVRIDESDLDRLRTAAKADSRTVAYHLRQAIAKYFAPKQA